MNIPPSPYAQLFKTTKSFTTQDGTSIRYVSLKTRKDNCRGTVLLLNGWTEFVEKYGEPISKLLDRGFDVYSLDWRGQGLSSRALPNREKGHVNDFSEFVDDLYQLVTSIILPEARQPYILMAHSMGGNISIQYLHDHPGIFKKAIFCCPMFDLPAPFWVKKAFGFLAISAKLAGLGGAYIPGRGNWAETPFEENNVTSDPERYAHDLALLQSTPSLRIGGPTCSWLNATLKAIKRINSKSFLEKISIPIMLFSGTADKIVSIPAHHFAAKHLPKCELVTIEDGKHELLREADAIQEDLWNNVDRFLADNLDSVVNSFHPGCKIGIVEPRG
ncbi:MAG: alpha/beta hydrolase [Proteobacteria bacterium]|nr:alpha/beta hydrolase [Pseudomonadota bacterium]